MKKHLLLITALILCLLTIFSAVGCGETSWGPIKGGPSKTDAVESNGGMVVKKGEYIYFVNGVESYTSSNKFGKVVKGSICRAKESDLSDLQVIVPKIINSGDQFAGIQIYGNYVYYASPTTSKDKDGKVQNTYLDFCRTKLDGTGTERLFYVNDRTTQYRFIEVNGTLYIMYFEPGGNIYSYNTAKKEKKTLVDDASSFYFSQNIDYNGIFFTRTIVIDEETEQKEFYNNIYKVTATGEESLVLSGEPSSANVQGYALTIKEHKDNTLFFSKKWGVEGGDLIGYFAIKDSTGADFTDIENGLTAAQQRTDASTFLLASEDNIDKIYFLGLDSQNASYGFIKKDEKKGMLIGKYEADNVTLVLERLNDNTDNTISHFDGTYLYYYSVVEDSDNMGLYRVDINTRENLHEDTYRFTSSEFNNAWLKPEIINGYMYFANAGKKCYDYVYRFKLEQFKTDDNGNLVLDGSNNPIPLEGADLKVELVGKFNKADKEALDSTIASEEAAASSSTSSSK